MYRTVMKDATPQSQLVASWLMPDSGSRGRGFKPHSGQTVLCPLARRIYSQKELVIPRKRWLRPSMTEKLFTGALRINQTTNKASDNGHQKDIIRCKEESRKDMAPRTITLRITCKELSILCN